MSNFTVRLGRIRGGLDPRGWVAEVSPGGFANTFEAVVTVPSAVWEWLLDTVRDEGRAASVIQKAAERWLAHRTEAKRISLTERDFDGLAFG